MTLRERIAALVEPLKIEETALVEQRDELQAQLSKVNDDLREVQKLLRVADPEAYAKERSEDNEKKPSEETIARILRLMWADPARVWTLNEIADTTGFHSSSVSNAMMVLRQRGDVRSLGRIQRRPGQVGPAPLGFKVADAATPTPPAEPKKNGGKKNIRTMISPQKLDELRVFLTADPEREWTRSDAKEALPVHRTQIDFGFRILEEDGVIKQTGKNPGTGQIRYKVVT